MVSLNNLPVEIITMIGRSLVVPPLEISEIPPNACPEMCPDNPWFNFTRCRRGLHSMCLVSRHLSEIARPLLYCVVPLWHDAEMVLFFPHPLQQAPQRQSTGSAPSPTQRSHARDPLHDSLRRIHKTSHNADPEALDIALANHAKHLQALDVRWDCIKRPSFVGPDGRLTSLAEMQSLRLLCVQMALLYGKSADSAPPFINLLPPNLVELTLEEWWWSDVAYLNQMSSWGPRERVRYYLDQKPYRHIILCNFMQFACNVRQRLHGLKKVVLLCKIPWTWVQEGAAPIEDPFEKVRATFLEQGVELSVEYDTMDYT